MHSQEQSHFLLQGIEKAVTSFAKNSGDIQMTIDNLNFMAECFMSSKDFKQLTPIDRNGTVLDFNLVIKLLNQINLAVQIDKIANEKGECNHAA